MPEVIQDSIQADSVVLDTLKTVVEFPARDADLVQDITQIFGSSVSKGDAVLDVLHPVGLHTLSWFDATVLFVVIALYIIIIKRHSREIVSVAKIIFFPALFNKTHEMNSVRLKNYLTCGFIFSVVVITLLSWLYVADGDFRVSVAVYMYFVFKMGLPYIIALRQGRRSPISKITYLMVSFCATSLCVLTPIAVVSMLFGVNRFLYVLIIIVLSSYYLFLGRYFYKEKFSFKQLLLYLCTAEVIPLALVSCLFYTKIITFGN